MLIGADDNDDECIEMKYTAAAGDHDDDNDGDDENDDGRQVPGHLQGDQNTFQNVKMVNHVHVLYNPYFNCSQAAVKLKVSNGIRGSCTDLP